MRQASRAIATLCLLVLAGGCGSVDRESAPRNRTDRLLREFMQVALGAELDQRLEPRIRKWQGPVRIAVPDDAPAPLRAAIEGHAARLAAVTGHDIRLSPAGDANLLVATPRRGDVPALIEALTPASRGIGRDLGRANCFFLIRLNRKSEIVFSHVIIPMDLKYDKVIHCIIEEVTQTLGLINDNNSLKESIFNDSNTGIKLSGKDEFFLRLLYSSHMKPGMSAAEIRALLAPCVDRDTFGDPATWQTVNRLFPCG